MREFIYKACFRWLQVKEISTPTCQILTIYIEVLTGFNHIFRPDGLNTIFLSQGCVLGAASWSKEGKWNPHSKNRRGGKEPLICPDPIHASTSTRVLSKTFPDTSPCDRLVQSRTPHSTAMCPEWSATCNGNGSIGGYGRTGGR